jgi:hypothetical protein
LALVVKITTGTLTSGGVWLTKAEAELAGEAGFCALKSYSKLATFYHKQKKSRFAMVPKIHYLHHCFLYLLEFTGKVDWILNPMCEANMMEEETTLSYNYFKTCGPATIGINCHDIAHACSGRIKCKDAVGRNARLSRKCHGATVSFRVLQRFMTKAKIEIEKYLAD